MQLSLNIPVEIKPAGMGAQVNEQIQAVWKEVFPNREYNGVFQDE